MMPAKKRSKRTAPISRKFFRGIIEEDIQENAAFIASAISSDWAHRLRDDVWIYADLKGKGKNTDIVFKVELGEELLTDRFTLREMIIEHEFASCLDSAERARQALRFLQSLTSEFEEECKRVFEEEWRD